MFRTYFFTVGDALSQLSNAVLFNSKDANQSISGRSYRQKDSSWFWGKMYIFVNFLFQKVDQDHCKASHDNEILRAKKFISEN